MKKSRIIVLGAVLLTGFSIGGASSSAKGYPDLPIYLQKCDYVLRKDNYWCWCCNFKNNREICKVYPCGF